MNRQLVLIVHNLRSCHNVGSLLRTADGLGVQKVYLTGYTPYPAHPKDDRLPHLRQKIDRQIHKTALGAEHTVAWEHHPDITVVMTMLRSERFTVVALEQNVGAKKLPEYKTPSRLALIIGREVEGIEIEILDKVDTILEIPMFGQKESFNVVQAAAMALYHMRFVG